MARLAMARGQPWHATAEDAVAMVEVNELARGALNDPRWPAWREMIRGLALEHGAGTP
jgi:hypothetical protein